MIKAMVFDLDGTLLDRDQSVQLFIENQYDRLKSFVGHIQKKEYTARFIELEKRGYVWKDKVYKQLTVEFGITGMTWEELLQDYLVNFKNHCIPFPDLLSMLEELKRNNCRLAMITNGYEQFQMENIKSLGIESYFDAILISEREGIKKPDVRIFEGALEQLDTPPAQAAFLGDDVINDVRASQNAGMISMWKRNPYWENVRADFIIDDLGELPLLVKKINNSMELLKPL